MAPISNEMMRRHRDELISAGRTSIPLTCVSHCLRSVLASAPLSPDPGPEPFTGQNGSCPADWTRYDICGSSGTLRFDLTGRPAVPRCCSSQHARARDSRTPRHGITDHRRAHPSPRVCPEADTLPFGRLGLCWRSFGTVVGCLGEEACFVPGVSR